MKQQVISKFSFESMFLSITILVIFASFLLSKYIHPYFLYLPVLVIVCLFFLTISLKPYLYLSVLTFIVFFQYIGYKTPYQKYLVIWDEILVIFFALLVVIYKISCGDEKFNLSPFANYIGGFFIIFIVSLLVNNSPFMPALFALRFYCLYILLFYSVLNIHITNLTIKKVIDTILVCFILQVPIIMYQLYITLTKFGEIGVDAIYGSFPGANSLSYACLYPIFLFLGIKKFKVISVSNMMILSVFILILILGQGRFAILLFPFILSYIYIVEKGGKFTSVVNNKFVYGSFLIFFFLLVYGFLITNKGLTILKDYYRIVDKSYLYPGTIWWKLAYYPVTYKNLTQAGIINTLFGLGPGMYGSFAGMKYQTTYTQFLSNFLGQKEKKVSSDVASQIIVIWGEMGFLGLLVYFLLLFKIFKFAVNCYRTFNNDNLVKSLSCGV
ncbi:MAG: hypothetical protein NZ839_02720, partial [Endomicrobia bacterium]|nr:hypothetical protein [Endomicrobiia bacterium]